MSRPKSIGTEACGKAGEKVLPTITAESLVTTNTGPDSHENSSAALSRDNVNRRIRGVTARPWKWAADGSLRGADGNAIVFPRLREGDTLHDLVNRDADAEFLIRAVNERDRLRAGLEELLDVAERIRGGDPSLDPEQWYATRDYARKVLSDTAD